MKLTNTAIKGIEPPPEGYALHWDGSLRGFGLRVTHTGVKSYFVEARVNGKTRRHTIGRHGTITANQARNLAKAKLGEMTQGSDPTAAKRERKVRAITLREVANDYKANRRTKAGKPLKDSTKADIDKHVGGIFEDWAGQPITRINRDLIVKRYQDGCKASIAQTNQAMRVLNSLINYAAGKYFDGDGKPIIGINPVRVLRDTSMLREVPSRTNAVPAGKIGQWWSALQAMRADPALTRASRAAADCIALMAVTGLRISEARTIRWEDLDLEAGTLHLADPKNREAVTLPLSDAALDILNSRPAGGQWVFPARSGKGHLNDVRGQLEALADETGVRVTAHDLRRTFIQIGFKHLGFELWRVKLLANHKVPKNDVTLQSYGDLSDRRFLSDITNRISEHLEQQRRVFDADNVVSMEGKRA